MRMIVIAVTLCLNAQAPAQHALGKIWKTEARLKFPEEVVIEEDGEFL